MHVCDVGYACVYLCVTMYSGLDTNRARYKAALPRTHESNSHLLLLCWNCVHRTPLSYHSSLLPCMVERLTGYYRVCVCGA